MMSATKYTHRRSTAWTADQWEAVEEYADRIGMSASCAVRVLVMQGLGRPASEGMLGHRTDRLRPNTVATRAVAEQRSTNDVMNEIAKAVVANNQALFNDPRMDDDYQPESD